MSEYADLEIRLSRWEAGSYAVEFLFSQPDSETDVRLRQDRPVHVSFDQGELNKLAYDPAAYGKKLTQLLFADPSLQAAFAQARAVVESLSLPLRLRLIIDPGASELNNLRWETLQDPSTGSPFSTSENIVFSRYLHSEDWRPVQLRAKGDLRALAVVANPSDLAQYNLAEIDVEGELGRTRQGLGDIPVVSLPGTGAELRATVNDLISQLRQSEYDILYLICHGAIVNDLPWLWLEDEQGKTDRVSGADLITRFKELVKRPRLVVLATCESAGAGTGDAMAALGPRLAESGIPAVLAIQGKISLHTLSDFMLMFFRELQKDGQIDRAVSVARGVVRESQDYWMPALFMRLKSGRIWYVPGFGDGGEEFERWQSLVGFIRDKACTPILGPGYLENILESRRLIAMSWAEKNGYPLAPQDRDVLPRVAQYVITRHSPAYLSIAVREALHDAILRSYPNDLPPDLQVGKPWSYPDLVRGLDQVLDLTWKKNPLEFHRLLAQMRLPIYILTGPLDLMRRALIEAGAQPETRICPWNDFIPKEKAIYEDTPTPEKPLIYHLFGHLSVPNSLVYAEDRYFDYLIGITRNKDLIPLSVRAALTSTSLLFLGLQMDDWEFRVFFRFLMAQSGKELLKAYSHAAVQVEPEEDLILDIKRARKYLENYFESENIEIYWGGSDEFVKTLSKMLES